MFYVMSDIHGCWDAYQRMLRRIGLRDDDQLCILGDVIDRGPDGIRILQDTLERENVTLLLGNHELMMRETLFDPTEENVSRWAYNGCAPTISALSALPIEEQSRLLAYLCRLPVEQEVTVNGRLFRLVHAAPAYAYDPQNPRRWDQVHHAVWRRLTLDDPLRTDETLVFGHTAAHHFTLRYPSPVWFGPDRIDIDCGCASAQGQLGCLRLDDMQEFYEEK